MTLPMRPLITLLRASMAATLLAGACAPAQAQADLYRRVIPPNVEQGGTIGVALLAGREYPGSEASRVRLLPSLDYQWRNGLFAGVLNGVGYNASSRPDLAWGVRVTADFGREERRSAALAGLGDIEARPEFGAFVSWQPSRAFSLGASLRWGSGNGRDGLLVDAGAGWSTALGPALRLGASLATTWANAAYAQAYFGIDSAQAVRSGYGVYTPAAGVRDVRVGATLVYRLVPAWSLAASVTRTELLGDAKRSPIVRAAGSTSAVLALGYSF